MAKNGEAKMRFIKVAKAPLIGERLTKLKDGTETTEPFHYALEGFLEEYVWLDDRWSTGVDGDGEAWALAFDRLTDALAGEPLGEGVEIQLEPEDWLKLRLVATSVSHTDVHGRRVPGVDPRIARVVRKAHINSIVLARSGPAPKVAPLEPEDDEDEEETAVAPS